MTILVSIAGRAPDSNRLVIPRDHDTIEAVLLKIPGSGRDNSGSYRGRDDVENTGAENGIKVKATLSERFGIEKTNSVTRFARDPAAGRAQ